jgi:flagellin-like hook-associated protein FlgL
VDADIVSETVALARSNIARQMATGIIAQAQLNSGCVLTLLTGAA